jgi:small ligand-binding sensory domain FIST
MTATPAISPNAAAAFTVAHAQADHWGLAAKSCLEGIAARAPSCNIGFLYATDTFAPNLSSILTFLRATTRIQHWIGGAAPGVSAGETEYQGCGALAVMVGWLPPSAFRTFSSLDSGSFRQHNAEWLAANGPCVGVVHADARNPATPALINEAAAATGFLVGGLLSAGGRSNRQSPAQVADTVISGGLSGLLLGGGIEVISGLTQGCAPIGPLHTVTEAWEGVVMSLDHRPALDVLREEVGELLSRDLRRAAGYIHVGLPVAGSDVAADYAVRNLLGIDPRQNWLAIADRVAPGNALMFVRRDANAAQKDLRRMLAEVKARLAGRPVLAAVYVSCVARGLHMFGAEGAETALVQDALGAAPLIGFFAHGEISRDRVYGYTGVLTLLPGEPP